MRRLLVCESHFSRHKGLAHERAGAPTEASRRGRGISPGLAIAWLGLAKLLCGSPSFPLL